MKKSSVFYCGFTIVLLSSLVLAGCQKAPTPAPSPTPKSPVTTQGNIKIYTNYKYNFTFNMCNNQDFDIEENYRGTVATLAGPFLKDLKQRIGVFITVENLPKNTSFEDYLKSNVKAAESTLSKFAITNETNTTISGIKAKQSSYTYTATLDDMEYVFDSILVVFMKDNKVYGITYDVPDDFHKQYADCFNLLISSFKFLE
jgi:hypothetical protein